MAGRRVKQGVILWKQQHQLDSGLLYDGQAYYLTAQVLTSDGMLVAEATTDPIKVCTIWLCLHNFCQVKLLSLCQ